MSAFQVSPDHLNVLLSWAINMEAWITFPNGSRGLITEDSVDVVARALHVENWRSVSHRYSHRDDMPGIQPVWPGWRREDVCLSLPEVAACIACVDYQSCEHPGWRDSWAHGVLADLRDRVCDMIMMQGETTWHWDAGRVAARSGAVVR